MVKKVEKNAATPEGAETAAKKDGPKTMKCKVTAPNHVHRGVAVPVGTEIEVTQAAGERLIEKKKAEKV